jgi:hypothetical protein
MFSHLHLGFLGGFSHYQLLAHFNLIVTPDSGIIRQIKSRRMRRPGHVAHMGEGRNVYRVLMAKPEGKRPLVRPRRRWDQNEP